MKILFNNQFLRVLLLPVVSVIAIAQLSAGPSKVDPTIVWKEINGVRMPIPPKVHPRLYLRSEDIPELRQRRLDPSLSKVWKELNKLADDTTPQKEPAQKDWRYYFDQRGVTVRAELDALAYLTDRNPVVARRAITSVLDTLEKAQYPRVSDISRAIGRIMISGAIVYDWCYDQLTVAEKDRFVKAFVRLAEQLECGYPPTHGSSVTGHVSEWMLMRDLLSVSIAIYDEYPEMYNLTAGRFFAEHLPVRNWLYAGNNHHQGSSYINVRYTNEMFAQWIFNRMGAGDVFSPDQQCVLYGVIYLRRPDGQVFPSGDVNHTRKKMKTYALPAFLAASYYKDEYLNYEAMLDPDVENQCKIFDYLWRDTRLGVRKPNDLPLTRYFSSPFGWMNIRTGWGDKSVIAEMKVNEYNFSNHQHLDAGAFQIYYKGPLAIDGGTYQGSSGGYNSPHNKNYFKRTIAHNSLLVFDPKESFKSSGYGGENKSSSVDNDGGQRLPGEEWGAPRDLKEMLEGNFRTGEVLAKGFGPDSITPDYSYLKGDITKAYSDKVKEVKRSFLFINRKQADIPAVVIVFDRVVASDPSFKKYWLLHSIEKPEVNGSQTIIRRTKNGDSGVLVCQTLLPKPANAQIETVGGEGKEFWVFGKNYANKSTRTADEAGESGAWRVEVSPKTPVAEDRYLQVMQVTDTQQKSYLTVQHTSAEGVEAVRVGNHLATFSSNSQPIDRPFSLTVGGKEPVMLVVTDLQPGTWRLQKSGKVIGSPIKVKAGEGVLTVRVDPGKYRITR